MSEIDEIASKHLGRSADGSLVQRYVTPDSIDRDLLVAVPREQNRVQYGIDSSIFVGFDSWNCYEFSFLLENGFPLTGIVRIKYQHDSKYIVESKSLKLYLNSFNMHKFDGIDPLPAAYLCEQEIKNTLSELLKVPVYVKVHLNSYQFKSNNLPDRLFSFSEDQANLDLYGPSIDFVSKFEEDPSILEINKVYDCVDDCRYFRSSVLRSNCRVTNQPDWADVYIYYKIKDSLEVTPESLLRYLISFRKENHFHEEVCECIYKRLHDLLSPKELFVMCLYTRRGGIDINPVRSSHFYLLEYANWLDDVNSSVRKSLRQ